AYRVTKEKPGRRPAPRRAPRRTREAEQGPPRRGALTAQRPSRHSRGGASPPRSRFKLETPMEITASLVKELRERTGAGMMECKKALTENKGDIDTAAEWLRKQGLAKADKKAGRVAAEGRIVAAQEGGKAVLVEVNSETDFVAKDENFGAFAEAVAKAALASGVAEVEALKAAKVASGETVEEARAAVVAKVGENVQVRRLVRIDSDNTVA